MQGRWLAALVAALFTVDSAAAQFVCPPFGGPFGAPGVLAGNGFGFHFRGRRLTINGYLADRGVVYYGGGIPAVPVYPYGIINSHVTFQYVTPPVYVPPARLFGGGRTDDDVSGVDLDLVPVKKAAEPPAAKPATPLQLPGVDVSVPKKPVRPEDLPPDVKAKPEPPRPPPEVPLPPPKNNPAEEAARLLQLGLTALGQQEYGLAAFRFRQSAQTEPELALAHFLSAQAEFALGKYKKAVASIEQGMRRKMDWPKADFNPRKELYKGNEPDFIEHLDRLEKVRDKNPDHPSYLFLHAYVLWFDGRQAEAVPLFQRARAKTADPTYIDAFLKAAPPGLLVLR